MRLRQAICPEPHDAGQGPGAAAAHAAEHPEICFTRESLTPELLWQTWPCMYQAFKQFKRSIQTYMTACLLCSQWRLCREPCADGILWTRWKRWALGR